MNVDFLLGIIGLCGGVLCAIADILLDLKGKGNERQGPGGIMNTNWEKMALWRFKASIWLAAVSIPMYLMGVVAIYRQMLHTNEVVASVFGICAVVGSCGTLFIHTTLCYFPIISKTLSTEKTTADTIRETISEVYKAIFVPLLAFWLFLVVVISGIIIYAILTDVLLLSWWFIFLTPLLLVIVGLILRLINSKVFADLPGICMPSIGVGMIGLMAAVNSLM